MDLHLLQSKKLLDNFDNLDGNEKYHLTRNMVAIALFLKTKKVDKDSIDSEIKKRFKLDNINQLKRNMVGRSDFVKKYSALYHSTFNSIMEGIEHGAKQEQTH